MHYKVVPGFFIFWWLSFLQPETHWNHFRSGRQEFTKRSMPQTESLIPDNISTLSALEFSSSMPLCMASPFSFFLGGGGAHGQWGGSVGGVRSVIFTVTIFTNVHTRSVSDRPVALETEQSTFGSTCNLSTHFRVVLLTVKQSNKQTRTQTETKACRQKHHFFGGSKYKPNKVDYSPINRQNFNKNTVFRSYLYL